MIVCSCNVFSDADVRSVIASASQARTSRVYASLGCAAKCGRCAHTIKTLIDEASPVEACCSQVRLAA